MLRLEILHAQAIFERCGAIPAKTLASRFRQFVVACLNRAKVLIRRQFKGPDVDPSEQVIIAVGYSGFSTLIA
jgi:hypothetical protein